MRVAVGGFHHETNTFAPSPGDLKSFQSKDAGGIRRGDQLTRHLEINFGYAGFIKAARDFGWQIAPLIFAAAPPSNIVTREAFETISGMILDDLRAAMPVDAVFLDLHGAMVAEHHQSGDEEVLRRVREIIGPDRPLIVEFDFHANISAQTARIVDSIFLYRTYPHVDMAEVGRLAANHLKAGFDGLPRPAMAFRALDFLIPVPAQTTLAQPMIDVYAHAAALQGRVFGNGKVHWVSLAPGFPLADSRACRPTIIAYADNQMAADTAADDMLDVFNKAEPHFASPKLLPEDAINRALEIATSGGTVVLADTQDNPGGGGNGDTVGILRALMQANVDNVLVAHIWDPDVAQAAHNAGVGAILHMGLGAKTGWGGETPVDGPWIVEQINDGEATGTGPMGKGWRFHMGPSALLRQAGVRVAVISGKGQCLDQEQIRLFGIDPSAFRLLVLKSSVHFRADFTNLAKAILVVTSPGPVTRDHNLLTYRNLAPEVRLMPRQ